MVLDASACINMYCNIKRKIMKNQASSLGFGIHGKIFVYRQDVVFREVKDVI